MLRSSLRDYSDMYILVKGTITVPNTGTAAAPDSRNKKVIFKNCTPFTDCISEINNKEINRAKDIDVVMPVYNSVEHSDNYFNDDAIIDVPDDPDSASFKYKQKKKTDRTGNYGTKSVPIMVPLNI